MISLQTSLKRKDQISCVIGYSGKIINQEHLDKNIASKPEIYLMHGDIDQVVPLDNFLASKEFFIRKKIKINTKIFQNCEHRNLFSEINALNRLESNWLVQPRHKACL